MNKKIEGVLSFYSPFIIPAVTQCPVPGVPSDLQPDLPHAHTQREEAVHLQDLREGVLPELRPEEAHEEASRRRLPGGPGPRVSAAAAPDRGPGLPGAPHGAEHPLRLRVRLQALVTTSFPAPPRRQDLAVCPLSPQSHLQCGFVE